MSSSVAFVDQLLAYGIAKSPQIVFSKHHAIGRLSLGQMKGLEQRPVIIDAFVHVGVLDVFQA
jgi:hypothetical protein